MERGPTHDVIVVGLGAWGGAAADHLARRGQRVLGLDAHRPPHRRGSHHGDGRAIRMTSPEAPAAYAPLVARAYELWRDLERDAGTSLLTVHGALSVGAEGDPIVTGALASYRAADVPHDVLDPPAARRRFPWLAVAADEIVVFERGGGVVRPEPAITAQLRRARRNGAEIRTDEPVIGWSADDDGVRVRTGLGEHRAERMILTAGVGAPALLRWPLPVDVERQVVAVYEAGAAGMAPIAVPSAHGECFYGIPEEGGRFKVGIHHGGLLGQAGDGFVAEVAPEDLALIARYVHERLPGLPAQPVSSATCRYATTLDRNFVIGPHPDSARVLVATGDSGHGFKLAPSIGELLADLAAGRLTTAPAAFDPGRFASTRR